MEKKVDPIWLAYVKTESGDESYHGYWTEKPSEEQVAKLVVSELSSEIEYWVRDEGRDMDWAQKNPVDALNCAMIDPVVVELGKVTD